MNKTFFVFYYIYPGLVFIYFFIMIQSILVLLVVLPPHSNPCLQSLSNLLSAKSLTHNLLCVKDLDVGLVFAMGEVGPALISV